MSSESVQDNMPEQELNEPADSESSILEPGAAAATSESPERDDALSEEAEREVGAPIFAAAPLNGQKIQNILEAALMAAGQPLSMDRLLNLFLDTNQPSRDEIHQALAALAEACEGRGIELVEVASGFRYQARQENAEWVARLWEEKPARYSRALLETLALIAYRQPITRGDIEDIRGVSVSTNIIKTLMDRDWVKVVGHRDVPGKPAMYASTRQFLDYFSLKNLSDLPSLAEIRDIDSINAELDLAEPGSARSEIRVDTDDAEVQLDLVANDVIEAGEDRPEASAETTVEAMVEGDAEGDLADAVEGRLDAGTEADTDTDVHAETDGEPDAETDPTSTVDPR
ncbi:MAG: SMC-Scp complex subunit ScpB [Gammaproteobacteria bacterium]|nr:SMC-Scp complex subunit ScpB [Gammaproteobacteria bacterium]